MVSPIFMHYIVNYFLSALVTEINIKIRHTDPFRIEKPFKQKVIPDRIDPCNSNAISR